MFVGLKARAMATALAPVMKVLMEETETTGAFTLSSVISDISTFFTAILGWAGDVFDFIVGEPICLLFLIVVPFATIGISVAKRLLHG